MSTYVKTLIPNPSVALPISQLILQPFRCFTYVTAHSQSLLSLLVRHKLFTYFTWRAAHEQNSFSNLSVTSRTSQLILELLVALPTSQLVLQPFRYFTYVIAHFPTLLSLLRHRIFTYATWRAAQDLTMAACGLFSN